MGMHRSDGTLSTASPSSATRPSVSVGIFAHEHEPLVGHVVRAFAAQRARHVDICELIVVTSGCSDALTTIVREVSSSVPTEVIVEPCRRGKLVAINEFLQRARGEFVVIASGDAVPECGLVESLCRPLLDDPTCGMTGPRVVNRRTADDMLGRVNQLLWELHDAAAQRRPKLGEIVAVRRALVPRLPTAAFCDEVVMEATVVAAGLRLAYVRDATAVNFGVTRWRALFEQRRRIHCQHLFAQRRLDYTAATLRVHHVAPVVARRVVATPRLLPRVVVLCGLEAAARTCGRMDFWRGEEYCMWTPTSNPHLAPAVLAAVADE
jgi:hypothetical protein